MCDLTLPEVNFGECKKVPKIRGYFIMPIGFDFNDLNLCTFEELTEGIFKPNRVTDKNIFQSQSK